jgi:hypothetical protein
VLDVDITVRFRNFDIKKIVFGRSEAALQNKRHNVTHFYAIFLIIEIMRVSVTLSVHYMSQ